MTDLGLLHLTYAFVGRTIFIYFTCYLTCSFTCYFTSFCTSFCTSFLHFWSP